MVARTSPDSTASPTATLMVATVPSCGATTGISIFMASSTRTASPAFTAVPAAASILQILPGTEAVTSTLPAAPAGAAAFGAAGAAFGAGAAFAALTTGAAPAVVPSSTVTLYTFQFTVMV